MVDQAPSHSGRADRAEGTRRKLLEVGRAAFARKGLAAVNLKKDILEPAGVSVGSFYHQFKDKSDLLAAILAEHSRALRARLSEVHRPDGVRSGEEVAFESYSLLFDVADDHEDGMRILLREREDDPRIRRFIEEDRRQWRQSLAGDYTRIAEARGFELQAELAAELIGILSHGALQHYLSLPRAERAKARERLIGGLVRLTLRGLPGLTPSEDDRPRPARSQP
jgi:AcrR family transcriptional regulator